MPWKIVLQLEGSLQMDVKCLFVFQAVLLEQDPAVKILPHLCFFFLPRCPLLGWGQSCCAAGLLEGQPCLRPQCQGQSPRGGGESPWAGTRPLLELVGRWCRVLVIMESRRRLELATVNTSNLTENKRCLIVFLITRIYHRLLVELAKLALCLIPSIWSKLLAVRFLNPARRRNFGSVSGQTPRGPRGGRGI